MTFSNTAQGSLQYAPLLGTLTVIPWTGEQSDDERNPPFLLAYSLGDGCDGAEAGQEAMHAVIKEVGLRTGPGLTDVAASPAIPITLLVQAGRAVLTMPYLKAQCAVPRSGRRTPARRARCTSSSPPSRGPRASPAGR